MNVAYMKDADGARLDGFSAVTHGWTTRNAFPNPDGDGAATFAIMTNSSAATSADSFLGWPKHGTKSHKISNTGSAGYSCKVALANSPGVTNTQTWTFAADIFNPMSSARTFYVQISSLDTASTERGVTKSADVTIAPGQSKRVSFAHTIPAYTPAAATLQVIIASTGAGGATSGDTFYMDDVDLYMGSSVRPHMSGAMPGGAWEGAAHASASYGVLHPSVTVREGPLLFTDSRVGAVRDSAAASTIDNAGAFGRAMSLLASSGGELFVPKGVYPFQTAPAAVPGGVWIVGEGFDYGTPSGSVPSTTRPSRGSVFRAQAAMSALLTLGTGVSLSPGNTGASIRGMSIDANSKADSAIKMFGSRNNVLSTQVYSGAVQAILMACQNGVVDGCQIRQDNTGNVILVQGSTVMDNKIRRSNIAGAGATGAAVKIIDAPATDIENCHLWAGAGGVPGNNVALIWLVAAAAGIINTRITANTIEGVIGDEVVIDATNSTPVSSTSLTGNTFYMNETPQDNLYSLVNVRSGTVSGLSLTGGSASGSSATNRYKSAINVASGATLNGYALLGIPLRFVSAKMAVAGTAIGYDAAVPIHNGTSWS